MDLPCGNYEWSFDRLTEVQVNVLSQRAEGKTLEQIGGEVGLTRERIRQIEKSAFESLQPILLKSSLGIFIKETFAEGVMLPLGEVDCLASIPDLLARVFLRHFRLNTISNGSQTFVYRNEPSWARQIRTQVPMSIEAAESVVDMKIDDIFGGLVAQLTATNFHSEYGFYGNKSSDLYYLFLQKKGTETSIQELCKVFSEKERNVLAKIDRDERIKRNFTDKSVLLSEWPEAKSIVNSAMESLLKALEQYGPQKQVQLVRRAQSIYSRSASRYIQVLDDSVFGKTEDGLIDLVANGAKPRDLKEPKRSKIVREYSNGLATVDLKVDGELMRGAGPQAPKRLAWLMGLRNPEDYVDFTGPHPNDIRLKIFTSGVSFSSLRVIVEELGLRTGCEIQVALKKNKNTFGVRAICECHVVIRTF